MSIWRVLFRFDSGDGSIKVRQDKEDNSRIRADRIRSVGGGRHIHESYKINTSTGSYREYHGGENASDRGYNKK